MKEPSSIPNSLTAVVLTRDEAPNIGRCLEKLRWVSRVVLVDSFSKDETVAIAREFPNVEVVQREFDEHAKQWTSGVERATTEWVLALDADYMITDELAEEIRGLNDDGVASAHEADFIYCIHGRPLRGTLYTPTKILFRRSRARYVQEGHTQRLQVDGRVGRLTGKVRHDDRKPLSRWFRNQLAYAALEADHLRAMMPDQRALSDRLRLGLLMPLVVPFYCLVVQRGILDGWSGIYYALQRTLAEILIALDLLDGRLRGKAA
jgi:glycosyltransferase involved in cell wall biosynthesis